MPKVINFLLLMAYKKKSAMKLFVYFLNIQLFIDTIIQPSTYRFGYLWYNTYIIPGE
jgi:hypothetical protein